MRRGNALRVVGWVIVAIAAAIPDHVCAQATQEQASQPGEQSAQREQLMREQVRAIRAQTTRYFRQGADATSVPPAGQPGADYFRRGADVTSVPRTGEPGAEIFERGADVHSLPNVEEPIAADNDTDTENEATRDDETTQHEAAAPNTQASAPTVPPPAPAQDNESDDETPPPASVTTPPPPSDGVESLLPAWPNVAAPANIDHASPMARPSNIATTSDAPPQSLTTAPRDVDPLDTFTKGLLLVVRITLIGVLALVVVVLLLAWRALKHRHH